MVEVHATGDARVHVWASPPQLTAIRWGEDQLTSLRAVVVSQPVEDRHARGDVNRPACPVMRPVTRSGNAAGPVGRVEAGLRELLLNQSPPRPPHT